MLSSPDFLILYGLVALIICYLLIKYVAKISFRKRKRAVLEKFKSLRLESVALQKEVSNYMLAQNAEHLPMANGVTVSQFLRQLKYNHASHLSSKLIEKLQNSDNPLLIKKTAEELNEQEGKLKEAQTAFTVLHKA